ITLPRMAHQHARIGDEIVLFVNIGSNQINDMNAYLCHTLNSSPSSPITIPTTFKQESYSSNDQIWKKFTLDKTYCFQYPALNWIQIILLLFLLVWKPLRIYLNHFQDSPLAVHSYLFPSN
ncbi:hypothetical protein VP01_6687g1, partial [Puccinia sorghi]